jgi:hypothetical protein
MNVMRKFGLFLIFLATVALAQSAVSADGDRRDRQNAAQAVRSTDHSATHPQQTPMRPHGRQQASVHQQSHHSVVPCQSASQVDHHNAAHSDHDKVALTDMHSHLLRHFSSAHFEPSTFGTASNWSHEWELRWIDYHSADGRGRVYHTTHKHDARQRFTMVSSPRHPHERTWHPVH